MWRQAGLGSAYLQGKIFLSCQVCYITSEVTCNVTSEKPLQGGYKKLHLGHFGIDDGGRKIRNGGTIAFFVCTCKS